MASTAIRMYGLVIDTFIKVVAWYDSEWGYSNKCLEMVRVVSK